MSDLVATNCGNNCGCERCERNSGSSCCNIIWILLILSFFSGNGCGCGSFFNNNGDNDCCSIIWILLLLSCCGGSNFFGGNGCGCGC